MNLQQQVQQHLDSTGISLRELSRRSGVSHTAIGKILRGGDYKNKTAYALNTVILRDSNFAKIVCSADDQPSDFVLENRPAFETLDATVEQLAAQCIDADLTHVRDDALECGKQRRIEALEAEVSVWQRKHGSVMQAHKERTAERDKARADIAEKDAWIENQDAARNQLQLSLRESLDKRDELEKQLAISQSSLNNANTAYITHSESWKAACVRSEQLQKQLDHANAEIVRMDAQLDQALQDSQKSAAFAFEIALNRDALQSRFDSLQVAYDQQVDDKTEMLAQIDTLFAERDNTATKHDQQIMRLRVYVWMLIAALVFVVASGLVVWGGV